MGSAGILEFSMFNLPVGGVDADQYFTTFQVYFFMSLGSRIKMMLTQKRAETWIQRKEMQVKLFLLL